MISLNHLMISNRINSSHNDQETKPPNVLKFEGHTYSLQDSHRGVNGNCRFYYRCKAARSDSCKGRLTLQHLFNGKQTRKLVGFHCCKTENHTTHSIGGVYDCREDMKKLVEEKSLKELAKSANEIASEVLALTKKKHEGGLF